MQETKKSYLGILGFVICLVLAILLAFLANALFSDKITEADTTRLDSIIALAVEGNAGYENIGSDYGPAEAADTALYLVKSGTGGVDSYAALNTVEYRGCTVELLCAFSYDGIISSVHLIKATGGVVNAKELIEESGMLASFGGASYDAELTKIKTAEGAGNCNGAVILAVNEACDLMKSVLYTEEVSQ